MPKLILTALSVSFTFTWVSEMQRPILAIHPREGRALIVSRPAERRPMSLGGSLRPSQAQASWEEKQCHCSPIMLFPGATRVTGRAYSPQG